MMIKKLYIKNFVLIDELEIDFDKGLNILTGETGSGKSIIIDAIDLAFGARAAKSQIKTGTEKAYIELTLEDIVISREITQSSTKSRIDGVLVTQAEVQELKKNMLDIHTQHESYNYVNPATHIELLDSYGYEKYGETLKQYKSTFENYKTTQKELEDLQTSSMENERKADFLKFQIQEINEAKIEDTNEYNNLTDERMLLLNAEELKELTFSSYNSLYGDDQSITDVLNTIQNKLDKASEYDKKLSEIAEVISSSVINLKESSQELRNYSENLETNPERLNEVEDRLNLLEKLKKKYGPELSDVLDNLEKYESELAEITFSDEKVNQLKQSAQDLRQKSKDLAQILSFERKELAEALSILIQEELIKLEMPKARFSVSVKTEDDLNQRGYDSVEFLISPNTGESLKPLAKIASGGEISRVMLAIKSIFAKTDKINTVIFDEIDTGISGKASQAVAESLAELATNHQIICITHQPIIAAMGNRHIYIQKVQEESTTRVSIKTLDEEARIKVIAELASGSGNDEEAISFAQKLLKRVVPLSSRT